MVFICALAADFTAGCLSIKSCAVGWIVTSGEMQLRKPITAAAPARAAKDSKWKGDKRMKKGKNGSIGLKLSIIVATVLMLILGIKPDMT